jgi:hypothetical protein
MWEPRRPVTGIASPSHKCRKVGVKQVPMGALCPYRHTEPQHDITAKQNSGPSSMAAPASRYTRGTNHTGTEVFGMSVLVRQKLNRARSSHKPSQELRACYGTTAVTYSRKSVNIPHPQSDESSSHPPRSILMLSYHSSIRAGPRIP